MLPKVVPAVTAPAATTTLGLLGTWGNISIAKTNKQLVE